ncbi:MAG: site-specific DNA-methyltransferase [Nitrosarchaeum sp.]|nr:site-specific DNA-methyltransferase [Nitrosarchaeum sp.]
MDPPFFSDRNYEAVSKDGKINSFGDKWSGGLEGYLNFMRENLQECYRVLNKKGSLYVHCDWHASHYLKVELDKIFGYDNFRNEIVWRRHNSHNDTKQGAKIFGRVHDVILFYSKTKDYTWNPIYAPYPEEYVQKYYKHIEPETGRRYAKGDLSGPGGRSKGNPRYSFKGVTRYWRFSKENMKKLEREGKIIQTKKGNVPVMKRYLDEMPGIMLQDVWNDVKSVQITKKELVDYPTQKPVRLLERIIEVSTNEKDIVLDPMCGSGTTLVAAKNLGRKFLGIDKNQSAIKLIQKRLFSLKPSEHIKIPA